MNQDIARTDADIVDLLHWIAMSIENQRYAQVMRLAADEIHRLRRLADVRVPNWRDEPQ